MLCLTKDEFASIILLLKFMYSEKAIKFFKISTVDLSYLVIVKPMFDISQKFCGLLRIYELYVLKAGFFSEDGARFI